VLLHKTVNCLKWTRNEKVGNFENRKGPKRRKKENTLN
jgi:hypothetical protein